MRRNVKIVSSGKLRFRKKAELFTIAKAPRGVEAAVLIGDVGRFKRAACRLSSFNQQQTFTVP